MKDKNSKEEYGTEKILGKNRLVRYWDKEKSIFSLVHQDDVGEIGQIAPLSRKEWEQFLSMRKEMERELKRKAPNLPRKKANEIIALATNRAIGLGKKHGLKTIKLELEKLGMKENKSRANFLLEQFSSFQPFTEVDVVNAFEDLFQRLGVEGVRIPNVQINLEGGVIIEFSDEEGDSLSVLFDYDPEEGPYAMVVSDDDEQIIIDLSPLSPPLITTQLGNFINLRDLSWMNLSTIKTLFQAGDIGTNEDFKGKDAISEVIYKKVIRQGKVVKIPVVKRKRNHRLTPAQRRALALARRKAHTAQAKRKRKLSLKIRKQKRLD